MPNRLLHSGSPYLLQHAHNPVDWYPWGSEALETARLLDKPILLSIGYAACHWCHVMEKESFEDPEVAALMNQYFVCIKVDREERPDLDHLYMEALQVLQGQGGWPLNIFLTPDARPFYGGTYFPPQRAFNRPSWTEVLHSLHRAFLERRQEIEQQATQLLEHLAGSDKRFLNPSVITDFDNSWYDELLLQLNNAYDSRHGGFGGAPKFPHTLALQVWLREYVHTGNQRLLEQVRFSVRQLIRGGIFDQLGGGVARYSTDEHWLVPHFEKMLYDNALLLQILGELFAVDADPEWKEAATAIVEFVQRELRSADGGFYASLDADSEGVEGKFYVWSQAGIESVLGPDAALFCRYYQVSAAGNWEGSNILNRKESAAGFAKQEGLEWKAWTEKLREMNSRLLAARSARIRPALDHKHLLNWNALMNVALQQAGRYFGVPEWIEMAHENTLFLLQQFKDPATGEWLHLPLGHPARVPALLDDLALLIQVHLEEYQQQWEVHWLEDAAQLTDLVIATFKPAEEDHFYFAPLGQTDLIVRKREWFDNVLPSGNAVMLMNLWKLSRLVGRPDYATLASRQIESFRNTLMQYPLSFPSWVMAAQEHDRQAPEIVVLGPEYDAVAKELQRHFIPDGVMVAAPVPVERVPLLQQKKAGAGTQIFICKNFQCQLPLSSVAEALRVLKA